MPIDWRRRPWRHVIRRGSEIRAEVDDEIRFHIEMRIADLQRRGLNPSEARAEALRQFGNLEETRAVYQWIVDLCVGLGADPADMVPFEKYANAALSLESPSSAARALAAGAPHIERVDRLVQSIAAQRGLRSPQVDEVVARVDAWLVRNRRKG